MCEIGAVAKHLHLRQRPEDVLDRPIVNVQNDLLKITLGGRQQSTRGDLGRRGGARRSRTRRTRGHDVGCRAGRAPSRVPPRHLAAPPPPRPWEWANGNGESWEWG